MIKFLVSNFKLRFWKFVPALMLILILGACSSPEDEAKSSSAVDVTAAAAQEALAGTQSTETAVPAMSTVEPSSTPIPTDTPQPTLTNTAEPTATHTPEPTATDTPEPTATPTASPTPTSTVAPTSPPATAVPAQPTAVPEVVQPTTPAEPVLGVNLIPNGSFEEGHYNQDGVPELQLPVKWRIAWDEGPTGMGGMSWDVYVRPEASVLSTARLPPEEHALYIYNGQHTLKVFKGQGAVSFRLMTDVTLEPGTYIVEAKMFADIVEKWENGQKVWSNDPHAAEFRFLVGDGGTFWTPQRFGQINVHNFTFTVDELKTITIALALRGRYAIANNGWFIDDLSLRRIE